MAPKLKVSNMTTNKHDEKNSIGEQFQQYQESEQPPP
jgi:hypothetical protein